MLHREAVWCFAAVSHVKDSPVVEPVEDLPGPILAVQGTFVHVEMLQAGKVREARGSHALDVGVGQIQGSKP